MSETYLTEDQLCERLHVAPRTAQKWRYEGNGPAWCRLGGRRIVYRLSDIEAYVASRICRSRAAELAQRAL